MKVLISLIFLLSLSAVAETHRVQCVTYNKKFKRDGGSFIFEGLKYASIGQIKEIKNLELDARMLERVPPGGRNNFMKQKVEGKHSKIIGLHVVIGKQDKDAPNRIELKSFYNMDMQIPDQGNLVSVRDRIMNFVRNKYHIKNKLYNHQLKNKYFGHITFYNKFGMINHDETIPVQCKALSNTNFLNSELTDWDTKLMKDGGWVMPKVR
jgi:hypothetical protein